MRQRLLYIILSAAMLAGVATSCSDDAVNPDVTVLKPHETRSTEFDEWLKRNYLEPYNIRFEYKMPDRETSYNYHVSPPDIDKSIMLAKVIKYTTLEAMVEMMSSDDESVDPSLFVKTYFPRLLVLVGSFEISSSGTVALASAENGLQINILGVNFFTWQNDAERIAGTMLHEFTHILDGTHAVPAEYKNITTSDYVGDRYSSLTEDPLKKGFVSNYARSNYAEDVAETGGRLITMSTEEWEDMFARAGAEGGAKLRQKYNIIKNWLRDTYGVDADRWSAIYRERISRLGSIDWTSLDD